jgi:predicted membrane protein
MEATMYWITFYLIIIITSALLIRLFFLYSEYVKLNSLLHHKTDEALVDAKQEDSAKNEVQKVKPKVTKKAIKKATKKSPSKKSKKKKG